MPDREVLIEQLLRKYGPSLYAKCARLLNDRHEAEDAVQETFVRAYQALPRFRENHGHLSWLHRIATNVCFNMLRTRRRKGAVLKADLGDVAGSLPAAPGQLAARRALHVLLEELDERGMQIFVAHFIDGMDQGEVAQMLGVSRRAVVKRLTKLRNRLVALGERDVP